MPKEQTKQKIIAAYCAIAKDTPQERIHPNRVISTANVSRSTFYRCFSNLEALRAEMETSLLNFTAQTLHSNTRMPASREDLLINLIRFFQENSQQVWTARYAPEHSFLRKLYQIFLEDFERLKALHKYQINEVIQYLLIAMILTVLIPSPVQPHADPAHLVPNLNRLTQQFLNHPVKSIPTDQSPPLSSLPGRRPKSGNAAAVLINAYLQLAKEIPQPLIHVKQLVDRAGVTRSTFYIYYENLDDFRKDLENDCLLSLCQRLEQCFSAEQDVYQNLLKLFDFCKQESIMIRTVRYMPNSNLLTNLRETVAALYREWTRRHHCHFDQFTLFCASTAVLNLILPNETRPDFSSAMMAEGLLSYLFQLFAL